MLRWVAMTVVVMAVQEARSDSQTLTDQGQDAGDPLFLTSLLEAGQFEEARRLSRVFLQHHRGYSHSGFLTVNREYNSNLFFWFFPAEEEEEKNAPLVVWQEGGPGTSSLYSLFNQNGPFLLDDGLTLLPRNYSWTKTLNMLYIDAPPGAGLSFTEHELGYARDAAAVARELYQAVTQFFHLFPEYKDNDLYVAGIGEGGKHAAAFAVHIHDENPKASLKINLRGIAIGNGAQDPSRLSDHGELFYHMSFFDEEERDYFKKQTDLVVSLVQQQRWLEAFEVRQSLLGGGVSPPFFANLTDFHNQVNLMEEKMPSDIDRWEQFVELPEVRRALHLGGNTLNAPATVRWHLREEMMRSIEPWIIELLENNYRVLLYNGQLDLTFPYFATENLVTAMKWSRADLYFQSPRRPLRVQGRVVGYVKSEGSLVRVLVRNAGYLAALDQPLWTYDMINRFTREKPFN